MTLHEHRLRGAAVYLRSLLRHVRSRAAAEGRYLGVVFRRGGRRPGIPRPRRRQRQRHAPGARSIRASTRRFASPTGSARPSPEFGTGAFPSAPECRSSRVLRIGKSKIVSFSPLGSSTTGTLFLSNRYGSSTRSWCSARPDGFASPAIGAVNGRTCNERRNHWRPARHLLRAEVQGWQDPRLRRRRRRGGDHGSGLPRRRRRDGLVRRGAVASGNRRGDVPAT